MAELVEYSGTQASLISELICNPSSRPKKMALAQLLINDSIINIFFD